MNEPYLPVLKGEVRPTHYAIPEDLSYEDWVNELRMWWWLYEFSPWALGDLLAFGERKWGDSGKYEQAVKITGQAIKTLYNRASLSRSVRPDVRSEILSPKHHEAVRKLDPAKQEYYLKEGERLYKESNGHLNAADFRNYVEDQERANPEANVEIIDPPDTCTQCWGTGKCNRCHGSGEEPT